MSLAIIGPRASGKTSRAILETLLTDVIDEVRVLALGKDAARYAAELGAAGTADGPEQVDAWLRRALAEGLLREYRNAYRGYYGDALAPVFSVYGHYLPLELLREVYAKYFAADDIDLRLTAEQVGRGLLEPPPFRRAKRCSVLILDDYPQLPALLASSEALRRILAEGWRRWGIRVIICAQSLQQLGAAAVTDVIHL